MASVDYYLDIKGIEGESTDSKYAKKLEILSFSFSVSQAQSFSSGTSGGSVGRANFSDFSFSAHQSKAGPNLWKFCAIGEHIGTVKLIARKAGKEQQEYYTVTMTDAVVTSYSISGSSGGELPIESVTLAYRKKEIEYKPQKQDGTLDAPVKGGYDLGTNKAS